MMCAKAMFVAAVALAAVALAETRVGVQTDAELDEAIAKIRATKGRAGALQVRKASLEALVRRAAGGEAGVKVYPPIEGTDHTFFEKDYPSDGRPDIRTHFGHPYPAVQDSDDYDSDFVKDDNKDNGHYDAQMAYDRLRTLKRREEGALGDTERKAKSEAEAARAKARPDAAAGKEAGAGADKAGQKDESLKDAGDDLKDAQGALADCKSELEAELKKLADLMEEKSKIEVSKARAEAALVPLRQKQEKRKREFDSLVKDLEVHEQRHAEFVKELATSKSDLRKQEIALKKALAKLRKFRNKGLDENSEIYDGHIKRSAAAPPARRSATLAAFALGFCAARG